MNSKVNEKIYVLYLFSSLIDTKNKKFNSLY